MAHRVDEMLIAEADQRCPNCGGRTWWVAVIAGPLEDGEAGATGAAFVDLQPAPMARCAGCGLSADLADDPIPWDP